MDGKVVPIPGYEAPVSAFATTEHQSAESRQLQETLQKELEKFSPTIREKDLETIKNSTVKDLRFNTGLLNGKESNVAEEMQRRLSQYTDPVSDGGLKLNYYKFNELTGQDHEMGIGLGDIMPSQYTTVIIVTEDGRYRRGERGIVETSSGPRVGYRDTETGGYLATFSGDIIYVLDPPLTDKTKLAELLAQESKTRKDTENSHTDIFYNYGGGSSRGLSDAPLEPLQGGVEGKENPSLRKQAIQELNKYTRGKQFWDYSALDIKDPKTGETLWKYNPNMSEGENIYEYSRAVLNKHGMGSMISTIWGMVRRESSFNPFLKNSGSAATGLGQPMYDTWKTFVPSALKSNDALIKEVIKGQKHKGIEYPNSNRTAQIDLSTHAFGPKRDYLNYSRCNPYLNIYHTIIYAKETILRYKNNLNPPIDIRRMSAYDQVRMLYLSHHEGHSGGPSWINFLRGMQAKGINVNDRHEVAKFIKSGNKHLNEWTLVDGKMRKVPESQWRKNPNHNEEADTLVSIIAGTRNDSREKGARWDTKHFLNTWYSTAVGAANYATGRKGKPTFTIPKYIKSEAEVEQESLAAEVPRALREPGSVANPAILEQIRTHPSKYQPDAVISLGNVSSRLNRERAEYAAEWALRTGGAFITTGGGVSEHHKQYIKEGKESMYHVKAMARYKDLYHRPTRPPAIEDMSTSTHSNMSNSVDYLISKGYKKILIVSYQDDENHARRAARNLIKQLNKRGIAGFEIKFYEPDQPNLDKGKFVSTGKRGDKPRMIKG